jgi:hypothetical protein
MIADTGRTEEQNAQTVGPSVRETSIPRRAETWVVGSRRHAISCQKDVLENNNGISIGHGDREPSRSKNVNLILGYVVLPVGNSKSVSGKSAIANHSELLATDKLEEPSFCLSWVA